MAGGSRMRVLILLISLTTTACATTTNPAFQVYKDEFMLDRVLPDTSIVFGKPYLKFQEGVNMAVVAQCEPGSWPSKPTIVVNPEQWARFPDSIKRLIIYHEMGHCVLGLAHNKIGTMQPKVEQWQHTTY
jgi:hypothetical protein